MNSVAQNSKPSLSERLVKGPVGFRKLLQRLGPTFIKIGQFLALRPDLVPQEYCDELMRLLDQVPSFSWQEAKTILTEDLGREPTDTFAYVNPEPVAAGSLAQVHVARLKDGTKVAIKIQRPNIRERVLRDLSRARLLARLFELSGVSLIASPREVVEELTGWMLQEIDFHHELENLSRLNRLADGSPFERIPRPYPHFCSSRVLTSEYLQGVPISQLLHTLRSDHPEETEPFEDLGIDRNRLATNLLSASLRQIFRYRFFHADLHPGNLLALPNNVVGFVDFGLCDELDEAVRERQMAYLYAVYTGNIELMFKSLMEILIPSEQTDIDAFRREFFTETSTWLRRRDVNGRDYTQFSRSRDQSPTGRWMVEVMRSARRHRLQVPSRILSMYRALLTAESVANHLTDELDLSSVGQQFFERMQVEEVLRVLEPKNAQPLLLSFGTLLRDSPGQLQQLLLELSNGRFTLNATVNETTRVRRAHNRRARLIATSILSVGIALLLTIPDLPDLFGVSLAQLLSVALILVYIWIFIQWGKLE